MQGVLTRQNEGSGTRLKSVVISTLDGSGTRRLIAGVELRENLTGHVLETRCGPSATGEEMQALARHVAPLTDPDRRGQPIEDRWKEASDAIGAAGWSVEDGKLDLSIKLTIDRRTGRILATRERAHPLAEHDAEGDEVITRDLTEGIARTFRAKAVESAERLRDAVADGRVLELPTFLRDGAMHTEIMPQRIALDALRRVDVDVLDPDSALAVVEERLRLADGLNDFEGADRDVQRFISLAGKETDPQWTVQLLIARGNSAWQRQLRESAGACFRAALSATAQPDSLGIAWAHRGLAMLADHGSSEWEEHERGAMDAFLVGGSPTDAITSAVSLAHVRFWRDPGGGLRLLEKAAEWADADDLLGREQLAGLQHNRAQLLIGIQKFADAREAAERAADLRRGLMGAEFARVASLKLAALAADGMSDKEAASALDAQAAEEHRKHADGAADLNWQFSEAVGSGNWDAIANLRGALESSSDSRLIVSFRCLEAIKTPGLSLEDRLAILDSAQKVRARLPRLQADALAEQVFCAYAILYERTRDWGRALEWHQRVLAVNPHSTHSLTTVARLLTQLEKWHSAVTLADEYLALYGRNVWWLCYRGRALLRMGRAEDAFTVLKEAEELAEEPTTLTQIRRLKEEAIDACVTPPRPAPLPSPGLVVSREQLEQVLVEFSKFVSADKRMDFWKVGKTGKGHDWNPSPEQRAKGLLQSFLRGKFGALLEAFEEVRAGAGRIDLYLTLAGGLRIVVELKMCGGGYTKQYALEGIEQLVHYLQQRGTSLGYLVVFDGRLDTFAQGMPAAGRHGSVVIVPLCVDVRPTVKAPKATGIAEVSRGKGKAH